MCVSVAVLALAELSVLPLTSATQRTLTPFVWITRPLFGRSGAAPGNGLSGPGAAPFGR